MIDTSTDRPLDLYAALAAACAERGITSPEDFRATYGVALATMPIESAHALVTAPPPSVHLAPPIDALFRRWKAGKYLLVREADTIAGLYALDGDDGGCAWWPTCWWDDDDHSLQVLARFLLDAGNGRVNLDGPISRYIAAHACSLGFPYSNPYAPTETIPAAAYGCLRSHTTCGLGDTNRDLAARLDNCISVPEWLYR